MPTRMLVAAHKPATIPTDALYLPVHVGHALNPTDLGYQPDDDGDSISHLNASYCELTAVYWGARNTDYDGIGLSHYRRYFTGSAEGPHGRHVLSGEEAAELLQRYDVVLARPRNYYIETIESHYRHGHHGEDLDVLRDEIDGRSPEYRLAFDRVFGGRKLSLYNMFLMRREAFEAYCRWLFPLLQAVAERVDDSDRSAYQQRTIGYLGERLLNVWATANADEFAVGYRPVVNTDGEPKFRKAAGMVRRKLTGRAQ